LEVTRYWRRLHKDAYKIIAGKLFRRPTHRLVDNIKMDLSLEDVVKWQSLVNMIMIL
jgi:hypothetical protein